LIEHYDTYSSFVKRDAITTFTTKWCVYVDATFGAGGYSKAILESADCKVYAIDRDETVVKFYDSLNIKYSGKIKLFIEKFSNIKNILDSFEHL
jgi:16S rRNA C1402 N4-methylase RsmH